MALPSHWVTPEVICLKEDSGVVLADDHDVVLDHRYGAGNGSQGSHDHGTGRRIPTQGDRNQLPKNTVSSGDGEVIWLSEDPRGHSGRTTVNG